MDHLPEKTQLLIEKIAKDNGFGDNKIVTNSTVANDGDGYIGILKGLTIAQEDKTMNFVIKLAPTNEKLRQHFPTRASFLREIQMYEVVLPELVNFQNEYKIPKPFKAFPSFYGGVRDELQESLVLGNLKTDGYNTWNRKIPMDSSHLKLVLESYGRLHAVSLAMKRLDQDRFSTLTGDIRNNVMYEMIGSVMEEDSPMFGELVDGFFAQTVEALKFNPRLLKAIETCKMSLFLGAMHDIGHMSDDAGSVVAHADCWSANMLFKYDQDKNPTEVILIDWQLSFVGHLIFDLSYFFLISAGKEDLLKYLEYLKIYHSSLSQHLSDFGLDPDSVFPFDELVQQWNEKCRLGFLLCVIMLNQTISDGKTHDFEEMADRGEQFYEKTLNDSSVTEEFRRRITDIVELLVDNQFI